MRLRRLDLARYGHFSDFSIDFGEKPADRPDLHIVFGPNEAGKSTVLAAFLDLLFGIERQSSFNFLHDYQSMRIGAALEIEGELCELIRIKKDQGSLLGEGDLPVQEIVLTSCLGAIDRQSYQAMFCLDDHTLEAGGDSILKSEGDLGRLLFSAMSGLSALSADLGGLKEEAEGFFKPRARTSELKELKEQLGELAKSQKALDVNARQFAELAQKADHTDNAYKEARDERDALRLRHADHLALLDALPIARKLGELQESRASLEHWPDPPTGWQEELRHFSIDRAACEATISKDQADIARLETELTDIVVDRTVLALGERINALPGLKADYRSADDLEVLRQNSVRLANQLDDVVARLGRPGIDDPRQLLMPVEVTSGLRDLVAEHSSLRQAEETARKELTQADDRHAEAAGALEEIGAPVDADDLRAIVERHQGDALDGRVEQRRSEHAALLLEIEEAQSGLRPWQGDLDQLMNLPVPNRGKLACWQKERDAQAREHDLVARELAEKEAARDRLVAELERVTQRTGAVDDEQCESARAAREEAWTDHRRTLRAACIAPEEAKATADRFEAALARFDHLNATRLGHLQDVERLRAAGDQLATTNADLVSIGRRQEAAKQSADRTTAAIEASLAETGLPADMELSDLARWLERRDVLLQLRVKCRGSAADLTTTEQRVADAAGHLADGIEASGEQADRSAPCRILWDQAQRISERALKQQAAFEAAKQELRRSEADREARKRDLDAGIRAMQVWRERWTSLIERSWLGEMSRERQPGEVNEILDLLADLPGKIEKQEDLDQQVRSIEAGRTRFIETVEALATEAGEVFDQGQVVQHADMLRQRLEEARDRERLALSKQEELAQRRQRVRETEAALLAIEKRLAPLNAVFSAADFEDLQQRLEQAQAKADLDRQIEDVEQQLVERLKTPSLAAACEQVAAVTLDEDGTERLRAELVELETRLEEEDQRVQQTYRDRENARQAVAEICGDGEVARLEEARQSLLLEIEERAEGYLRLKIGTAAAEHALQLYRSRHQSSMMTRASDAFRRITGGRFAGLTTTPGKDGEVLVGRPSTGGSQIAYTMSKGTRFQLYLALRMAGYLEFAEQREPLPFIADDIMETFDDDRSAETFKLLDGLAEKGQVIYLTHHGHLCDLARQACGGRVHIHRLPPPVATASATIAAA